MAFEVVATELYELLKKKEATLASQHERMEVGFSVDKIHHFARFISSLEKKITEVQQRSNSSAFKNELV